MIKKEKRSGLLQNVKRFRSNVKRLTSGIDAFLRKACGKENIGLLLKHIKQKEGIFVKCIYEF